ncbi:transposase, MuDR, MULE transposase domain protein [Tanacetum coccineum]
MSEDLTYSSLHEMMMKKFNLEANSQINLSFKLSSFDYTVDITDDDELESLFAFRANDKNVDENNDSDDVVDENPQTMYHKWNKFMSFNPDIPDIPVYKSKPMISKQYSQESEVKEGEGTVTRIKTDDNGVFEMLFIAIGASIRTLLNYLCPVLMIDAAHLKGLYKGTNLVAVAMDGNNQIVPIAFGICKGETGPCWSWWMSVLKECIGDNPNLLFISDRHATIALAVEKEFPLAFHDPDAHEKLCRAGPQRWPRVHCPLVHYNYMTSNSVESVNACSVIYRKEPVLKLAETYRAMVQECKYDVRNNRLGSKQSGKKKMKSATWVVKGVNAYQYEVSDGQYIREVNLQTGICGCRKWQLSGLPCGHVIAITRFLGLTDCLNYMADWFKKPKYQATYSESIHSLGNMQQWEFTENIQKAIPPRMDNPQPGRPKNTKGIQSQGEEPKIIYCTRCIQTGHRRDQCGQPFVVQPPVNIRTHNDQQFTQNNQPSFNNPTQQFDNTFNNINHYTSQQYADNTYPSQPYCQTPYPSQPYDQHFANTSQPYTGHYTESSQMYEQYNSQQYDAQHLDDINTNGSNSWFNSFGF